MWVSRKEFNELKDEHCELLEAHNKCSDTQNDWNDRLDEKVDTLEKQMKCSCENYEVEECPLYITHSRLVGGHDFEESRIVEERYFKVCKDCGWTTKYDTEEEALADKQELLDRQIDALKEQKKALKK